MADLEEVQTDQGVIFAKSKNEFQIFEVKLKSEECKIKGILRFSEEIS